MGGPRGAVLLTRVEQLSENVTLYLGDCRDVLPTLSGIDAVVTDPPYGLSFMGKKWDYDVPSVEVWRLVLDAIKPGAHLLSFAGTRTQHRMAVNIEDAGFDIRDLIAWVYGSGFPKSLDVSKAIDKTAGAEREVLFTETRYNEASGIVSAGRDERTLIERKITAPATEAARQWEGWGTAFKPALEPVTVARKPLVGTVAENVLRYGTGAINVDGCRISALTGQRPDGTLTAWEQEKNLCDLCAKLAASPARPGTPATRGISAGNHAAPTTSGKGESARAGIGKANTGCSVGRFLEEPATDQTVDSSLSIGASGKMPEGRSRWATKSTTSTATDSTTGLRTCNACGCSITDLGTSGSTPASKNGTPSTPAAQGNAALGRWPSNLIHDGSEDVVGLLNDAARFFYCAKASKADRDEGCEDVQARFAPTMGNGIGGKEHDPETATPKRNHHPTVKPTALMRYLCRIITPPGGVVLDPFMGSGSTGKAAILEGFGFVGIERDPEYFEIACRRIAAALKSAAPLPAVESPQLAKAI